MSDDADDRTESAASCTTQIEQQHDKPLVGCGSVSSVCQGLTAATEQHSVDIGRFENNAEGRLVCPWNNLKLKDDESSSPPSLAVASSEAARQSDLLAVKPNATYGCTNAPGTTLLPTADGTALASRPSLLNHINFNIPSTDFSQLGQFPINSHHQPSSNRPSSYAVGAPSSLSTPLGSTFSISSRGYTSATAPSTASSCSSSGVVAPLAPSANINVKLRNPKEIPQMKQPPSAVAPENDAEDTNIHRIDSALLSALCDSRERLGLLRLEQVLIDFMNEPSTSSIEVGGPYNSVVIGGVPGGRLSNQEEIRGRQTSFQRLCLHRLADRFNIVRETTASWTNGVNSSSQPCPSIISSEDYLSTAVSGGSQHVPSLIRIHKVKNSRIPENLLIDLDVASYQQNRPDPEGDVMPHRRSGGVDIRALSESFAAASVSNNGVPQTDSLVFEKKPSQKTKKKMKIMKRSSGSNGNLRSTNGKKGDSGHGRGLKGKNISDKEKMYAEARARIFNNNASQTANTEEKDVVPTKTQSPPLANLKIPHIVPHPPSPPAAVANNIPVASRLVFSQYDYEEDNDLPIFSQKKQDSMSSTNGASKVTWRNRRQEENDPDFRRGVVRASANIPSNMLPHMHYGTTSPIFVPNNNGTFHEPAPYFVPSSHTHMTGKTQDVGYAPAAAGGFYQNPRHSNTTSRHSSYQQQYYGQHHVTTSYVGQEHVQNHQGGGYTRSSWTAGENTHSSHGMYYGNPGDQAAGRKGRDGIVFQPEDFPALG